MLATNSLLIVDGLALRLPAGTAALPSVTRENSDVTVWSGGTNCGSGGNTSNTQGGVRSRTMGGSGGCGRQDRHDLGRGARRAGQRSRSSRRSAS
jgi:hypothetical protein